MHRIFEYMKLNSILNSWKIVRATELWQQAGAYSVRIQGMGRQHHIPLEVEFDEHDGADSKYIVILHDEYPVTTCRFYELDADTVMLGRVVVLPEYRGKGLGKRTISEAEAWISELGYSMIRIESREEVTGLYQKLGYVFADADAIVGPTFRCLPMYKKFEPQGRS